MEPNSQSPLCAQTRLLFPWGLSYKTSDKQDDLVKRDWGLVKCAYEFKMKISKIYLLGSLLLSK